MWEHTPLVVDVEAASRPSLRWRWVRLTTVVLVGAAGVSLLAGPLGLGGPSPELTVHHEIMPSFSKQWEELQPMSTPRYYPAAVAIGTTSDRLVVMGGYNSDDEWLSSVEMWDSRTQQWSSFPSMRDARSDFAAVAVGSKVYVFGGYDGRTTLKSTEVLDLEDLSSGWQAFASMTQSRMSFSAAAIGQFIYITGGKSIGAGYEQPYFLERWSTVEKYDTVTEQWSATTVPDMSSYRIGHAAVAMGSQLVVVGGITKTPWNPIVHIQSTETNSVMFCDPKGHRSRRLPKPHLPFQRHKSGGHKWKALASMSSRRSGFAAAGVGHCLFVVGGRRSGYGATASAEMYDRDTNNWSRLPNLPYPRHGCAAAVVATRLVVVGGQGRERCLSSAVSLTIR